VSEWKLFDGSRATVSTAEFHEHRERAPHLEQWVHQGRLNLARDFVLDAASRMTHTPAVVSDLGCGDGGLLQLLATHPEVYAYGYDFQPSNAVGWAERGVIARPMNVFDDDEIINDLVELGGIVVMTEVLEHLTRPHQVLREIFEQGITRFVVASSPHTENGVSHDECHAWAWDVDGYCAMFETAGFTVVRHETTGMFQVILAGVA
jgi:hypothetical protein